MLSEPVISIKAAGKCYQIYDQPRDRLLQMFYRSRKRLFREFWALKGIDLDIYPGDVVGIVGRNGSGKSTLLQLVCNTLTPTEGEITVKGRIAALLELGAGFNPEFTGRENVYLSAMISGMSQFEVAEKFDAIVEFSGIENFIDQPVKTYSSGMYVRLAFSIAIHVDPDILIIDEALAVGDGEFSHKSFNRIMELKDAGKTILFCSHALYQIEAICNKALWLNHGNIAATGDPQDVVMQYRDHLYPAESEVLLNLKTNSVVPDHSQERTEIHVDEDNVDCTTDFKGSARITTVNVVVDGETGSEFNMHSGCADLDVTTCFMYDCVTLAMPNVALCFVRHDGSIIASVATHLDQFSPVPTISGVWQASVNFPSLPLLKGTYRIDVYLMCDKGIHVYDSVNSVATLNIMQKTLELGLVTLPHKWFSDLL